MAKANTDEVLPFSYKWLLRDGVTEGKVDPNTATVASSSDETKVRVTLDEATQTGMVELVSPTTAGSEPIISITGDADFGDGVESVTLTSEPIEVTMGPSGRVTAGAIVFGAPVPKPV